MNFLMNIRFSFCGDGFWLSEGIASGKRNEN